MNVFVDQTESHLLKKGGSGAAAPYVSIQVVETLNRNLLIKRYFGLMVVMSVAMCD